jgi:hypothetical protein
VDWLNDGVSIPRIGLVGRLSGVSGGDLGKLVLDRFRELGGVQLEESCHDEYAQ